MLLLKSVEDVGVAPGSRGPRCCLGERASGCAHLEQTVLQEGKGPLSLPSGATRPNRTGDVLESSADCPTGFGASPASASHENSRSGACSQVDPLNAKRGEETGAAARRRRVAPSWRAHPGSSRRASGSSSAVGRGGLSKMPEMIAVPPLSHSEQCGATSTPSNEVFCSVPSCLAPSASSCSSCSQTSLCSTPLSSSSSSTDLTSAPSPSSASCPSPSSSPPAHASPFSSPPSASPCSRQSSLSSSFLCPSRPADSSGLPSCSSLSSPAESTFSPTAECASESTSSLTYSSASLQESQKRLSGAPGAHRAVTSESPTLSRDLSLTFATTGIYSGLNLPETNASEDTSTSSSSSLPSSVCLAGADYSEALSKTDQQKEASCCSASVPPSDCFRSCLSGRLSDRSAAPLPALPACQQPLVHSSSAQASPCITRPSDSSTGLHLAPAHSPLCRSSCLLPPSLLCLETSSSSSSSAGCSAPSGVLSIPSPSVSVTASDASADCRALSSQETNRTPEDLSHASPPEEGWAVSDTETVFLSRLAPRKEEFLGQKTPATRNTACDECRPPFPIKAQQPPSTSSDQREGHRGRKERLNPSAASSVAHRGSSSLPERLMQTGTARFCTPAGSSCAPLSSCPPPSPTEKGGDSSLAYWEPGQAVSHGTLQRLPAVQLQKPLGSSLHVGATAEERKKSRKENTCSALKATAQATTKGVCEEGAFPQQLDACSSLGSSTSRSSDTSRPLYSHRVFGQAHSEQPELSRPVSSCRPPGCLPDSFPSSVSQCFVSNSALPPSSRVCASSSFPRISPSTSRTPLLTPVPRSGMSATKTESLFPPKPTLFPCTVPQQAELYIQVLLAVASIRPAFRGSRRHPQSISFHIFRLQKARSQVDLAPYQDVFAPLFRVVGLASTHILPVPGFGEWLIRQSTRREEDAGQGHGEQTGSGETFQNASWSVRAGRRPQSQAGHCHRQCRAPCCHHVVPIHDCSTFALFDSESSMTYSRVLESSLPGRVSEVSPGGDGHPASLLDELSQSAQQATALCPAGRDRSGLSLTAERGSELSSEETSPPSASRSEAEKTEDCFLHPALEEVYNRLNSLFCDLKSVHSFRLTPEPPEGILGPPLPGETGVSTCSTSGSFCKASSRPSGAQIPRASSAEGGARVLRDGTVTAEVSSHEKRPGGNAGGRGTTAALSAASRVASFTERTPLTRRFCRPRSGTVSNPDSGLRLFFPSSDLVKMMRESDSNGDEDRDAAVFSLTRASSVASLSAAVSPEALNRREYVSSERKHADGGLAESRPDNAHTASTPGRAPGTLVQSERVSRSHQPSLGSTNLVTAPAPPQLVSPTAFSKPDVTGAGPGLPAQTVFPLCSGVGLAGAVLGLPNFAPGQSQSLLAFLSCFPSVCTSSPTIPSQVFSSSITQQNSTLRPTCVSTTLQSVVPHTSATATCGAAGVPSCSQPLKNERSSVVRRYVSATRQAGEQSTASATPLPSPSSVPPASHADGGSPCKLLVVQPEVAKEGLPASECGGSGTGSSETALSAADTDLSRSSSGTGSRSTSLAVMLVSPSAECPAGGSDKATAIRLEPMFTAAEERAQEGGKGCLVSKGKDQRTYHTVSPRARVASAGQDTATSTVVAGRKDEASPQTPPTGQGAVRTTKDETPPTRERGENPDGRKQPQQLYTLGLASDQVQCGSSTLLQPIPVPVPVLSSASVVAATSSSGVQGLSSRLPVLKGVSPTPLSFPARCSISAPGVLVHRPAAAAAVSASPVTIRPALDAGTRLTRPVESLDSRSSAEAVVSSLDSKSDETTPSSSSCRPPGIPLTSRLHASVPSLWSGNPPARILVALGNPASLGDVGASQRLTDSSLGIAASLSATQASDPSGSARTAADSPGHSSSGPSGCRQSKAAVTDRTTTAPAPSSDPSSRSSPGGGPVKHERGGNGSRKLEWTGASLSTADGACVPLFQLFKHGWWATPIPPEDPPLDPDATEKLLPSLPSFPAVVYVKKDHCFFALWRMKDGVVHRRRSECALLGVREAHRQAVQTVCRLTRRPPGVVYDCKSGKWSVCVTRYNGRHRASFSVKKFGFEGAHEKAMEWYEAKRGQLGLHENPACAETVDFEEETRQNPQALLAYVENAVDAAPPAQPVTGGSKSCPPAQQASSGMETFCSLVVGVDGAPEKVVAGRSVDLWNSLLPALAPRKFYPEEETKEDQATKGEVTHGDGGMEANPQRETGGEGKEEVKPIQREAGEENSEDTACRRECNLKEEEGRGGGGGDGDGDTTKSRSSEQHTERKLQQIRRPTADVSPYKEGAPPACTVTAGAPEAGGDGSPTVSREGGGGGPAGVVTRSPERGGSSSAAADLLKTHIGEAWPVKPALASRSGCVGGEPSSGRETQLPAKEADLITNCEALVVSAKDGGDVSSTSSPAGPPPQVSQQGAGQAEGGGVATQAGVFQSRKAEESKAALASLAAALASTVTAGSLAEGTARSCSRSVTTAQKDTEGQRERRCTTSAAIENNKTEETELTPKKRDRDGPDSSCCSLSVLLPDKTAVKTKSLQEECQYVSVVAAPSDERITARPADLLALPAPASLNRPVPDRKTEEDEGHGEAGLSSSVHGGVPRPARSSQDVSASSLREKGVDPASSVSTPSLANPEVPCDDASALAKPNTTTRNERAPSSLPSPLTSTPACNVTFPPSFSSSCTPDSSSPYPPPTVSPKAKVRGRPSVTDRFVASADATPAPAASAEVTTEAKLSGTLYPNLTFMYLQSLLPQFSGAALPSTPALPSPPWKTKQHRAVADSFPTSPQGGGLQVRDDKDEDDLENFSKKGRPPSFLTGTPRNVSRGVSQLDEPVGTKRVPPCASKESDDLSGCQKGLAPVLLDPADKGQTGDVDEGNSAAGAHVGQMFGMAEQTVITPPSLEESQGASSPVGDLFGCSAQIRGTKDDAVKRRRTNTTATGDPPSRADAATRRGTAGGVPGCGQGAPGDERLTGGTDSLDDTGLRVSGAQEVTPVDEKHLNGSEPTAPVGIEEKPLSFGNGRKTPAVARACDKEVAVAQLQTAEVVSPGGGSVFAADNSSTADGAGWGCHGGGRRRVKGRGGIADEAGEGRPTTKKRRARGDNSQASRGKCSRR